MSTRSIRHPSKGTKKAAATAQGAKAISNSAGASTSRPATPTTFDKLKGKFKRPFKSSKSRITTEQVLAPPTDSIQEGQPIEETGPPVSLIIPVIDTPFKGDPDERAGEIALYDKGIQVVSFLQKLAGLTGPGIINPVPSILQALTGVFTQLQVSVSHEQKDWALTGIYKQMVKNEGEWKELFLLISKHLETFNNQLQLLELGTVIPNSSSALHKPIVQYSA